MKIYSYLLFLVISSQCFAGGDYVTQIERLIDHAENSDSLSSLSKFYLYESTKNEVFGSEELYDAINIRMAEDVKEFKFHVDVVVCVVCKKSNLIGVGVEVEQTDRQTGNSLEIKNKFYTIVQTNDLSLKILKPPVAFSREVLIDFLDSSLNEADFETED